MNHNHTTCPDCEGRGIINHNPFPNYLDFARDEIFIAVCTTCEGKGVKQEEIKPK